MGVLEADCEKFMRYLVKSCEDQKGESLHIRSSNPTFKECVRRGWIIIGADEKWRVRGSIYNDFLPDTVDNGSRRKTTPVRELVDDEGKRLLSALSQGVQPSNVWLERIGKLLVFAACEIEKLEATHER